MTGKKTGQKKFVHKRGQCSRCQELDKPGYRSRKSGKFICLDCKSKAYYHKKSAHKKCVHCHHKKPIRKRVLGLPLCGSCVNKLDRIACWVCEKIKPIALRASTMSGAKLLICNRCY